MELQPGKRVGSAVIEQEVSSARIGALYLVRSAGGDSRSLARVLRGAPLGREAELLEERLTRVAAVRHPQVTRLSRWYRHEGQFVLLYDLPEAVPLENALSQGTLPSGKAVDMIGTLAELLRPCHLDGLIHGNLTPTSVLITPDGHPWIADLGVFPPQQVQPGSGWVAELFDPRYASPEQLCHGEFDARADIFALGLLLFRLRFGSHPWSGNDWFAALERRRRGVEAPAQEARAAQEILTVVQRATDPNPDNRYQTLDAFLNDLRLAGFGFAPTQAVRLDAPGAARRPAPESVPPVEPPEAKTQPLRVEPVPPGGEGQPAVDDLTGAISTEGMTAPIPAADVTAGIATEQGTQPVLLEEATQAILLREGPEEEAAGEATQPGIQLPIAGEQEAADEGTRSIPTEELGADTRSGVPVEEAPPLPLSTGTGVKLDTVGRIRVAAVEELAAEELARQWESEREKQRQGRGQRVAAWVGGVIDRLPLVGHRKRERARTSRRKTRLWVRFLLGLLAALMVLVGVAGVAMTSSSTVEKPVPVTIRIIRDVAQLVPSVGWPSQPTTDFGEIAETGSAETSDSGIFIAGYIDGSMARVEPRSRITLERSVRVVEQPGPLAPVLARLLGWEEPRTRVGLELHTRLDRGETLVRVPPMAAEERLDRELLVMAEGTVVRDYGTQFGATMGEDKRVTWKVDDGHIVLASVGIEYETTSTGARVEKMVAYVFALGQSGKGITNPWPARFAGDEGRKRVFVEYLRRILARVWEKGRLDVDSRESPLLRFETDTQVAVYDLSQALLAPVPTPRVAPTLPPGVTPVTPTTEPTAIPTATLPPGVTPTLGPEGGLRPEILTGPEALPTRSPTATSGPTSAAPGATGTPGPYGIGTPSPTPTYDPFATPTLPPGYTMMLITADLIREQLRKIPDGDPNIGRLPPAFRDPEVARTAEVRLLSGAVVEVRLPRLGGLTATLSFRVVNGELKVGGLDQLGLSEDNIGPWLGPVNNNYKFMYVLGTYGTFEIAYGRK